MNTEVHFVYPYIQEEARWDELRYSIRSIEDNFSGPFKIFIVGDNPGWLSEEVIYIPVKRLEKSLYRNWLDVINKIKLAIADERLNDAFVLMADDYYITSPVTYQDFGLYVKGDLKNFRPADSAGSQKWVYLKMKTRDKLISMRLTTWDYETHLPRIYIKSKLSKLIRKFDLINQPYVLASLYYNYFYGEMKPELLVKGDGIQKRLRHKRVKSNEYFELQAQGNKFFNHTSPALTDKLKQSIALYFNQPSKYERDYTMV